MEQDDDYRLRRTQEVLSEMQQDDKADLLKRAFNVTTIQPELKQIRDLYDAVGEATKNDYGMKLLDKKALSMNIDIPDDVIRYGIADFLTPSKFGKPTAPIETLLANRNQITANPQLSVKLLKSALTYPQLYEREKFDKINAGPGFGYNLQNAFANLNQNPPVENQEET